MDQLCQLNFFALDAICVERSDLYMLRLSDCKDILLVLTELSLLELALNEWPMARVGGDSLVLGLFE